jgi:hypothetical protein
MWFRQVCPENGCFNLKNFMEQNPECIAAVASASREIASIVWNLKVHNLIYNSALLLHT